MKLVQDRGDCPGKNEPLRVLLVEPDPQAARWIAEMLRATWAEPLVLAQAERLGDATRDLPAADCILLALGASEREGLTAIKHVRNSAPQAALVVLAEQHDGEAALAALRAGAGDALAKAELSPMWLQRAIAHAIERARAEAELTRRALHDPLTELPNRALFLDRLHVALDRARRSGALVAVLFLDVDNFKDINDSRGHTSGDQLLVELAGRLRTMLRPMDTVARFGGDEFTFLFEDLADEGEVVRIAERVGRACRGPIEVEHGAVTISVSMGITMVSDPRTAPEEVIREADTAMYRAKERGRDRYELYDGTTRERALARLDVQAELRQAIDRRELRVHYQPSVSLRKASVVVGLEALVRWQHPERGLIAADEFIALAEDTGLVVEIGQYVLSEVLRPLERWRERRPDMTIAVNLSLRELEDVSLRATVATALSGVDVDPEALWVEVPERALARNPGKAADALRALRELGVRVAVDDFGTGPASVLALGRLPVDAVKLHGSLLAELDADAPPVLGAVVDMAHALGLEVVAEGVETSAQADELRSLGCDGAQGFLFARPVPEDEVGALLDGNGALEFTLSSAIPA